MLQQAETEVERRLGDPTRDHIWWLTAVSSHANRSWSRSRDYNRWKPTLTCSWANMSAGWGTPRAATSGS